MTKWKVDEKLCWAFDGSKGPPSKSREAFDELIVQASEGIDIWICRPGHVYGIRLGAFDATLLGEALEVAIKDLMGRRRRLMTEEELRKELDHQEEQYRILCDEFDKVESELAALKQRITELEPG